MYISVRVISKRRKPRHRTREQESEEDKVDEDDDRDEDSFDLSPQAIIVFVILMCGMLVSLYYFYDYLGKYDFIQLHVLIVLLLLDQDKL